MLVVCTIFLFSSCPLTLLLLFPYQKFTAIVNCCEFQIKWTVVFFTHLSLLSCISILISNFLWRVINVAWSLAIGFLTFSSGVCNMCPHFCGGAGCYLTSTCHFPADIGRKLDAFPVLLCTGIKKLCSWCFWSSIEHVSQEAKALWTFWFQKVYSSEW